MGESAYRWTSCQILGFSRTRSAPPVFVLPATPKVASFIFQVCSANIRQASVTDAGTANHPHCAVIWIEVAGSRAHDDATDWGKAHAGIDAPAAAHGRQARSIAKMREHHPSVGLRRSCPPTQLTQQEGVGQSVEAVTADAFVLVFVGNREAPRTIGEVGVKCCIEADNLRCLRI